MMVMRSIRVAMAAIAVLVHWHPSASAQRPAQTAQRKQPTATEIAQARGHFKSAEAAKARGEYKLAAVEYLAAYELFADPEFFFDVAEAYRLSQEEQDALTYYEKYLELDANGRGAVSARERAEQLRRSIAARQDMARRAAEEDTRRKAEVQARNAADETARLKAIEAAEVQRRESSGRNLRVAGIAAGAAGVAALGVGVYFGARARSISDQVSNAQAYDASRDREGKAANRSMFIFAGVGGAALVTGGILYYLGHRAGHTPARDTTVTVAPVVTPFQLTVVAQRHF